MDVQGKICSTKVPGLFFACQQNKQCRSRWNLLLTSFHENVKPTDHITRQQNVKAAGEVGVESLGSPMRGETPKYVIKLCI